MVGKYLRRPLTQDLIPVSRPPADQNVMQVTDDQNPPLLQSSKLSSTSTTNMDLSTRENLNCNSLQKKEAPDHKENIQRMCKRF